MGQSKKITPHLWFDKEAREAAQLYTSVYSNSQLVSASTIHDTPSGDADIISIRLRGQEFMLISAGPYFKFNPSISFLVACDSREEVENIWAKLSPGGKALMDLGEYPFSEKYGWIEDRYGLSWQIMLTGKLAVRQPFTPTLMFTGPICGKSEEAIHFYVSVFNNAQIGGILRYSKSDESEREGTIKHASFTIEGMDFAVMDSALSHGFTFNEAVSFIVNCDTQEEIDYFWNKLSADPSAEQCGWLKDKYGLSWQIVPVIMNELMSGNNKEKIARVTSAFLKMKKFDIAELEKAYKG